MLKRQKRLKLPAVEMSLKVEERYARAVRESAPYRYVIKPAMRLVSRNNGNGNGMRSVLTKPERSSPKLDVDSYTTPEARELASRVNQVDWYHTINLPHGITTPGFVDHRDQMRHYGLPEDMTGMRALDIATYDGFLAFEMERRGAEVVAIDIPRWSDVDIPMRWKEQQGEALDVPTGDGFRLAAASLNSKVDRREINVYDLTPEQVGDFDVVMISDLLQHLRDPLRALERAHTVTRPSGYTIVAEVYSPDLESFDGAPMIRHGGYHGYAWSVFSTHALKLMMDIAGYEPVTETARFSLKHRQPGEARKVILRGHPRTRNHDYGPQNT